MGTVKCLAVSRLPDVRHYWLHVPWMCGTEEAAQMVTGVASILKVFSSILG
jgi:hypothetical protein